MLSFSFCLVDYVAPYPISPVQAGFPSSSRPRFGTHRSSGAGPTQYDSIASVSGQTADEPAYGAEDDEEWERALAERRRNGGAAEDEVSSARVPCLARSPSGPARTAAAQGRSHLCLLG